MKQCVNEHSLTFFSYYFILYERLRIVEEVVEIVVEEVVEMVVEEVVEEVGFLTCQYLARGN